MSLPWSPQQREWLQALGHPLLVLAGAAAATESNDVVRPSGATARMELALELAPDSGSKPAPGVQPVAAGTPSADGLYRALLKATGQRPAEAEQALRQLAIDTAALRGNPKAKRALWPRLRHLRASRPG